MDIIFLGTPDFAVPSLRSLHDNGHSISLVITRPDRPRGRGREASPTPIKHAAVDLNLSVFQPASINTSHAMETLEETEAQLGITVAYGEILTPELLETMPNGFLNLHASLLPKYRGAAPIHWSIIRGEQETGITVQQMVPRMDAGPILQQRKTEIRPDTTAGQLHDELADLGAQALTDVVNRLDRGEKIAQQPQNASKATYAPKLHKSDGEIDWSQTARQIDRLIRGVTPWPGAHTTFAGADRTIKVTLTDVEVSSTMDRTVDPGTVLQASPQNDLVVQAGTGTVNVKRIKPANSRAMDADDFINGYHVQPGDTFT